MGHSTALDSATRLHRRRHRATAVIQELFRTISNDVSKLFRNARFGTVFATSAIREARKWVDQRYSLPSKSAQQQYQVEASGEKPTFRNVKRLLGGGTWDVIERELEKRRTQKREADADGYSPDILNAVHRVVRMARMSGMDQSESRHSRCRSRPPVRHRSTRAGDADP